MGKQKMYTIEVLNLDTGTKVKHLLDNAQLNYNELLEILESYNPQIDFDNLVVYYYTGSKWMILLQSTLNFDDHQLQWQDKESDEIQLKIKYHCFYILDEEEEKRFNDDVKIMNEKISQVHDLYQDLKEKYKQEALDIHIFWGSPLFAADKLVRNKKPMQTIVDQNKEEHQLLINQVKYAPYVNAVTTALESCDKKKVHLQLNLLNDKSFNQRSVFTVVYLMAHLEIEEINNEKTSKNFKKPSHKERRRDQKKAQKKEKPKKYVLKQETMAPGLKKTESQPLVFEAPTPALQKEKSVGGASSLQFQLIIEESQIAEEETQEKSAKDETRELQKILEQSDQDETTSTMTMQTSEKKKKEKYRKKQEQASFAGKQRQEPGNPDDDNDDVYYQKDYKNRKKGYRYYFLGEEVNGKLSKITPKKLKSIIKSRISRKIELLILQSSYPYYHLQELKELANNIILINSNPLFPEPSSIYFIKQFFIHLVQTGNIQQTYELSIKDLNKLKEFSLSAKNSDWQKEFDQKQKNFINNINERYVHGNLQCCCCYHKHHDKCHHRRKTSPSKFAEYHYKYHASQCQCIQENLMIHNCDERKIIMAEQHYDIIKKDNYHDNEFYYCCCLGYDLGFYQQPTENKYLKQLTSMNEEKDPHSIKYKYKYEKRMANEDDNQLQISQGKVTGDWSKEVTQAFKYIEENPLLGNAPLIIRLFEIFTQELQQCSLDIIRRLNQNQIYMLCNIYGEKSTGRKTIATYFAKLLIIKKMYKRIIIKVFNNASSLRRIVENSLGQPDGRPFFIFIHQDKTNKSEKTQLHLKQHDLGMPISAIIISDLPILLDKNLTMEKIRPIPFNTDNCQHYIKKYKHLSHQGKNNVSTIFHYGTKGYQENSKFEIYPFSLNQFQILNLISKTKFCQFKHFTSGLDRLSKQYIQYYIFLVYMIKFTNSPNSLKYINIVEIQDKLNAIESSRSLFFKHFDQKLKQGEDPQLIRKYSTELVNLNQIKDNFYLIFTSTGYKIKKKLPKIMQMFINHTTIIPNNKFNEDPKIKRRVNYLRAKSTPFSKQVYEATTINPASFINRYFNREIESIYKIFAQNRVEETEEMYDFQTFLKFHADLYTNRRGISKKLSYETHSKPKERAKTEHYSSFDAYSKESPSINNSQSFDDDQSMDIPHIYHLASVMQGGLQFVRNVISNHFIYNRLDESQKIEMIKCSVLLINNCIILLKNKKFYDIIDIDEYDVDSASQENQELLYTQKFFYETHSSSKLDSPYLKSRRSEEIQFPPPSASRTYSGRDVLNQNRLFSAVNSNVSNVEEDKQSAANDELLLKELKRLSTFKGLLFLLDEVQRRSQEIIHEDIVRIKICAQLLAIQIRLEQLQVDKQDTKVVVSSSYPDRHLLRISQIFNEKNHNISILYKILRQEMNSGHFNRDIEQLGLIKSHIIVSLSLMASRYGKYKIAKAKSMIRQIDSFLTEWNNIPIQRRESQQHENHNDKEELLNVKDLASQYGFLRMVCENQYVYIHILESFTSEKFWQRETRNNNEIEAYQELLRIYHHFSLKNTKAKVDYYVKLEKILEKLHYFRKKKESLSFSTYIHNFVEYFIRLVESQFKKLKSNLISIFNADDGRDYVKTSLQQQLQTILKKKNNTKEFFNIKKKFNLSTLTQLSTNCGCKYLCIFTSIGQNNSKEEILIQGSDGKSGIINKDKVTQAISSISSSVIFVCLPRKKMLAEPIIKANKFKRTIIYFDFQIDNFQVLKNNADSTLLNNNVVIFQKMIMIETVKELIEGIIQKENQGFKTGIYMAFNQCKNYLSFVLKSKDGKPLLRLSNKQFRNCLCIEQEDNFHEISLPPKQVEFFETQKVNKQQIESLEKIIKKMSIRKDKSSQKSEQFKIDEFYNVYHFIEIFSFYFRDKYGFNHIFNINFQTWKQDVKSNAIIKKFLEKLTDQKILDFIFSNNKGVIIMYFQHQCYDLYSSALKDCESQLKKIIGNIDQSDGKRTISKFIGYTNISRKKIPHIFIYILQGEDRTASQKIS